MINPSIYGQSFCIRWGDFMRAEFWANWIRHWALGPLFSSVYLHIGGCCVVCICTVLAENLLQTSKQARKAPKLTGKLALLGRNQPASVASRVKSAPQVFCVREIWANLQNDPWGNCILRPRGRRSAIIQKLFRGSYSNCTQRQMSIMVRIGKVELNSQNFAPCL